MSDRAYQEANKEKIIEQRKQYRAKNRDKLNEAQRLYRLRNKEACAARDHAYYKANIEKVRLTIKSYYEANRQAAMARRRLWEEKNPDAARRLRAKARERAVTELHQCYVAERLGLPLRDTPEDLIELKREQLRLYRLAKELKQAITQKENPSGI